MPDDTSPKNDDTPDLTPIEVDPTTYPTAEVGSSDDDYPDDEDLTDEDRAIRQREWELIQDWHAREEARAILGDLFASLSGTLAPDKREELLDLASDWVRVCDNGEDDFVWRSCATEREAKAALEHRGRLIGKIRALARQLAEPPSPHKYVASRIRRLTFTSDRAFQAAADGLYLPALGELLAQPEGDRFLSGATAVFKPFFEECGVDDPAGWTHQVAVALHANHLRDNLREFAGGRSPQRRSIRGLYGPRLLRWIDTLYGKPRRGRRASSSPQSRNIALALYVEAARRRLGPYMDICRSIRAKGDRLSDDEHIRARLKREMLLPDEIVAVLASRTASEAANRLVAKRQHMRVSSLKSAVSKGRKALPPSPPRR